jgi:uncharacterized protein YegL
MAEYTVLPFYAVCDESASMQGEPVDAINQALVELHQAIGVDPVVTDKTRFCLIGFSGEAEVLLPLSDMSEVASMPGLSADGMTSFGAAFRLLRQQIEQDVARLKADGAQVLRPAVFFMSDGQPNDDDWESAHAALVADDFKQRPNIIAFGFGDADEDTIKKVATKAAYIAAAGTRPAEALKEWAKSLTTSIVQSVHAGEGGKTVLVVPPPPDGMKEIPLDTV